MINKIFAGFMLLLVAMCGACFTVCGILFIAYDMCPIIERIGIVGSAIALLIFAICVSYPSLNAPLEDEDKDD